ncbi:hypothetical protein P170DRAFT_509439 [Aspergillus steynii IBT 23096]|uniref:Nephrocystin 3-like N-terminal domain-containing protein n=1 Tax=Aspergillus steynii IBT 23096 TaxID=1392250 RepID=A0A2I2G742_9EURO|nr:uncharacterized protein P170DRAFT_509439 [Aspergillus steynii IBT 23096]PLB48693.1 hypothetical protein P170DRAFT_509439 [Aspergillus steynii IBT 23096]
MKFLLAILTMNSTFETLPKLSCNKYTVGWLCVLNYEYDAARALLDAEHQAPSCPPGDPNIYTLGRIGEHNVVIAQITRSGTTNASTDVTNMLRTFREIRFGLMVGIGGGALDAKSDDPGEQTTDIHLGDVVVSKPEGSESGVVQYDLGKQEPEGFKIRNHLNSPGTLLLNAANRLSGDHRFHGGNMSRYIKEAQSKLEDLRMNYFHFPGRDHDLLFSPEYRHPKTQERHCRDCDRAQVIPRRLRPQNGPVVHYGLIASGNTLHRDPHIRDKMRKDLNVLCFEMEAAGLMNNFQCLVIRGISDYADTHKIDLWQPYAALTAAAYAKDLLDRIQAQEVEREEMASKLILKVDQIKQNIDDSYYENVLGWLTRLDFRNKQQELYDKSVSTGQWLIKDSGEFKYWVKKDPCHLRCYGEAGTGKTHLCALIVNHLQHTQSSSPVIYIYLSDEEDRQGLQTPVNLLGSMVQQLLRFQDSTGQPCKIPTTLRDAYHSRLLSEAILKQSFEELLKTHDRVYLIVDGLYQCSEDAVKILKAYPLDLIRKNYNLSILTTSPSDRQAVNQINCDGCGCREEKLTIYFHCSDNDHDYDLCLKCKEAGFSCPLGHKDDVTNDTIRVEVRARPDEIEQLCIHRLREAVDPGSRRYDRRQFDRAWKPSGTARFLQCHRDMIPLVAKKIDSHSQKNFLVAQTWIDWLLEPDKNPGNSGHLLELLVQIPVTPLGVYVTGKIEGIKRRGIKREEKLVFNTFMLMMTARQRLNILALQQALALGGDSGVIRQESLDDRVSILKATNGLILIEKADEKHAYVDFFHWTLPKVLKSCAEGTPLRNAKSKTALLCLKYLRDPDFVRHCADSVAYPFASYVLEHWGDHVRSACMKFNKDSEEVESKAMAFLTDDSNVRMIVKAMALLKGESSPSAWIHDGINVFHLCAWYGLEDIIRNLKAKGYTINAPENQRRCTPLRYACVRGHLKTVELLSSGLPVDDDTIAVVAGTSADPSYRKLNERMEIVNMQLKKRNLTLNYMFDFGYTTRTLLMYAVQFDHYGFAGRLLAESVDINARNREGYTALWIAVDTCPEAVPEKPLKKQSMIVSLLLRYGANPNFIYRNNTTVLAHAVAKKKALAVAALLECDALDLHAEKNIMHIASAADYSKIIPLYSALLQKGISSINTVDKNGLTPLHYAALSNGNHAATTARTLLNYGADPEMPDERGCTPFTLASLLGNTETMRVLSPGEDIERPDLTLKSSGAKSLKDLPALVLAKHGHWSTLHDVIVDNGASRPDLAHKDIITSVTLLHLAVRAKQFEILCLLLGDTPSSSRTVKVLHRLTTRVKQLVIPRLLLGSSYAASESMYKIFRGQICNGNVDSKGLTPLQLAIGMQGIYPNIANLLLDYHDLNCVCGSNKQSTTTRDPSRGNGPSFSVASQPNGTILGSLEKPSSPPETGVGFSVKLERRLFSVHSILMVMVLVLSMSSMWVRPWDGGGQGQGKED